MLASPMGQLLQTATMNDKVCNMSSKTSKMSHYDTDVPDNGNVVIWWRKGVIIIVSVPPYPCYCNTFAWFLTHRPVICSNVNGLTSPGIKDYITAFHVRRLTYKITSPINKSADWPPPNYHKTEIPNPLGSLIQ